MDSQRRALEEAFRRFRDHAAAFSREVAMELRLTHEHTKTAELNLRVTKAIFGKWTTEILVTVYSLKVAGFEDLRRAMGTISSRVLSEKLRMLEERGLILRTVVDSRPPRAQYSLTDKGLTVARLGEPIFLYLRYKEGLL